MSNNPGEPHTRPSPNPDPKQQHLDQNNPDAPRDPNDSRNPKLTDAQRMEARRAEEARQGRWDPNDPARKDEYRDRNDPNLAHTKLSLTTGEVRSWVDGPKDLSNRAMGQILNALDEAAVNCQRSGLPEGVFIQIRPQT